MTKKTTKELPITISLKLAGQDCVSTTDNILSALRGLEGLDLSKIKSRAYFDVTYNGNTAHKVLTIMMMKRLLTNDLVRKITAKYFNQALKITVDNYE